MCVCGFKREKTGEVCTEAIKKGRKKIDNMFDEEKAEDRAILYREFTEGRLRANRGQTERADSEQTESRDTSNGIQRAEIRQTVDRQRRQRRNSTWQTQGRHIAGRD